MKKCQDADFPCFNYIYESPTAPTFEQVHASLLSCLILPQVAAIKLKHTALALDKGVTVMLLDLDVGFLRDPMVLLEGSELSPPSPLPLTSSGSSSTTTPKCELRWTLGGGWTRLKE
jgi:hypothetical protein